MKTNDSTSLTRAAVIFAALCGFLPAKAQAIAGVILPPTHATLSVAISAPAPTAAMERKSVVSPDIVSDTWLEITNYSSDRRVSFFAGFKLLQDTVDRQIAELTATLSARQSANNPRNGDSGLQEMHRAQSYLKAMGDELSRATPATWNQQKDRVGQAWGWTQSTYVKVKANQAI